MRAKLKKTNGKYSLWIGTNILANTLNPDGFKHKLSLKNCQAIERGYDLDELAKNYAEEENDCYVNDYNGFKQGFQKALEILGDKKFSEEEIAKAIDFGVQIEAGNIEVDYKNYKTKENQFIQSLQQNEWDCIVEMEGFVDEEGIYCGERPKLDANECIILKRK